jgi:hypothetical protein
MIGFTAEWLFTLSAVALLALVGWPLTIPFQDDRRFAILLAPMFGLITLPMVVALFYALAGTSLLRSAIAAVAFMAVASLAALLRRRPIRTDGLSNLLLVIVVSAIATALASAAAIQSGTPSITFLDGSDHAGYGHTADWLIKHGVLRRPVVSPDVPYESWPQLTLTLDPRLGAFVVVALVAMARGVSGLFAYDSVCAVVGTVGPLAAAAVYARTRPALFLLALGVMCGVLFDLGRSGYLGKLMGYPAALLLAGLFMTTTRRDAPWLATMIVLTVGVATLHSGAATAFLLLSVGAAFLAAQLALEVRRGCIRASLSRDALLLALLVFIALVATGVFARPISASAGGAFPFGWEWLVVRFFEIENPQADRVQALLPWGKALLISVAALQLATIIAALAVGSPVAVALCGSPLAVLAALYAADQKWIAQQLAGILSWCTLAGIAVVHDDLRDAGRRAAYIAVVAIGLAFVAARVPRLAVAVDRYVFRTDPHYRFQVSSFEEIRRLVGTEIVEIDTDEPLPLVAVLNELGAGQIKLQWSRRAWTRAFWYRRWPPPRYPAEPAFRLTTQRDAPSTGDLVLETPQYRLWKLQPASRS